MRWVLALLAAVVAYSVVHFAVQPTSTVTGVAFEEAVSEGDLESLESVHSSAVPLDPSTSDPSRQAIGSASTKGSAAVLESEPVGVADASVAAGPDALQRVHFALDDVELAASGVGGYSVDWVDLGSPGPLGHLTLGTDGAADTMLAAGAYRCACKSKAGVYGPVIDFEVSVDANPVTVGLIRPGAFALRTRALHSKSEAPLQGVVVTMTRDKVTSLGAADSRELVTDSTGEIIFEDLTTGEWSFSLVVDGFAESSFVLELPGKWSETLRELGYVDFGVLRMAPITPLLVELDGHADWVGEESEFRVATGPDQEPVVFDAFGRATVPLGWFSSPVYLKLYYPNAQRLGLYLDGGLPEPGVPVEIKVGKGRTLEIDVQASQEVQDALEFVQSSFNVTGRTARGDSVTQGASVDGIGVHRVEGVAASTVRVSFSTTIDGRVTVLTSEPVTMKESGVTTCTLLIDSVPRRIVLKGASWQPGEGTFAEVRPNPDVTSWLLGHPVGKDGSILLPDLRGTPHSLRLLDLERRHMAIDLPMDLPVDLSGTQGPAEMLIPSPRKTRTRVLVDGKPARNVTVTYTGAHSNAVCASGPTDAEGWTRNWNVVEGSLLLAQPIVKELWGAHKPLDHPGGDLTIALLSTGVVRVPSTIALDTVRFDATSETLGGWLRESLIDDTSTNPSVHEYRIPVGRYSYVAVDGSTGAFDIASEAPTVVIL